MRNKITGSIGILWGSLVVFNWGAKGFRIEEGASGQGQLIGIGMGVLMLGLGMYYFAKKPKAQAASDSD